MVKVGILEMHSILAITDTNAQIYEFLKISNPKELYRAIGKRFIRAPAGAGTPTEKPNFERVVDTLLISWTLKRASRSAMHIAKKLHIPHPARPIPDRENMYRTMAGQTPKTTRSDSESSSAPKRLLAFSIRASRPSVASRIAAPITANITFSHICPIANLTCRSPMNRADKVVMLGTILLTENSLNTLRRFFLLVFIHAIVNLLATGTDYTIHALRVKAVIETV
jgi:hypothetical protein